MKIIDWGVTSLDDDLLEFSMRLTGNKQEIDDILTYFIEKSKEKNI